jgi:integrase
MTKTERTDAELRAIQRTLTGSHVRKIGYGNGLQLLLTAGASGWRFRWQRDGREKMLSVGPWPAVSLTEARKRVDEMHKQLALGVDPGERRKASKAASIESRNHTFKSVGDEVLARDAVKALKTRTKRAWLLQLLRDLHSRPINELRPPDFVRALEKIQDIDSRHETAHRAASLAMQICRYASNRGYIEVNPLPRGQLKDVLKPIEVENRAAIVDPKRFGELLANIHNYDLIARGFATVTPALKLIAYTFMRPGELRQLEWTEIDLDKAEILLPPAKTKMRRPHLIPLATQAVELLRAQQMMTGNHRYVFPGRNNVHRPLSDAALNKALRRMFITQDEHCAHGFRSTASTLLNGVLGYESSLVELQLAHVSGDVKSVYDRNQHVDARRKMLQAYADYLDSLRASHGKEK